MRELTIRREKRFTACLVKMKVYLEDPVQGELEINGVRCRKLGELKNGEEKTFSVGEEAARVYVIADKLSKSFCNEFYLLPEGQEPVRLTGRNRYNPAAGNAFRFDNNDSSLVQQARKRSTRVGIIVLVLCVLLGFCAGFFGPRLMRNAPKSFTKDGFTIVLDGHFLEAEFPNYDFSYDSEKAAVFGLKEEKDLFAGAFEALSLTEYAALVIDNNGLDAEIETENGLTGFVYDATIEDGRRYRYYSYVFKTEEAFWLVQFAVEAEQAQERESDVEKWAKSIVFAE